MSKVAAESDGAWRLVKLGILSAFAAVRFPGPHSVLNELCYDDAEIAEFTTLDASCTWDALPSETIGRNFTAISFFSPRAFRFFLPAFMIVGYEHRRAEDGRGQVLHSLVLHLAQLEWERDDGYVHRQTGSLDHVQRASLASFLRFIYAAVPQLASEALSAHRSLPIRSDGAGE